MVLRYDAASDTVTGNGNKPDTPSPSRSNLIDGEKVQPTAKVVGGGMYVTGYGEAVPTFRGQYQVDALKQVADPLSDVRTPQGSPVMGRDPLPTDIVHINGMGMSLAIAQRVGLVTKSAAGQYELTGKSTAEITAKPKAPLPEVTMERVDRDTEAVIDRFEKQVPGTERASAIRQVIENGELSGQTLAQVAGALGVEPGQAQAAVHRMVDAFAVQAAQTINTVIQGIDPDEVYEWARANRPSLLKEAMGTQARQRTTDGYRKLAQEFAMNLDTIAPEAILHSDHGKGVKARKGANGGIVIEVNGKSYNWQSALRHGIVKLGPAKYQ